MNVALAGSGEHVLSATQRRRRQRVALAQREEVALAVAQAAAQNLGASLSRQTSVHTPAATAVPMDMALAEPNPWRGPAGPHLNHVSAFRSDIFQAPFKAVKVSELNVEGLEVLRNPPSEARRQVFAAAAHTSIAEVGALFLFELPDYPIARAYQRWVVLNPASTEDVGVSVSSRGRFLQERGGEAVHKALSSLVARGRPEHCGWLLYDTARQD